MSNQPRDLGFATMAIHEKRTSENGSLAVPIYQTNSYVFDNVRDGALKCESLDNGYCYTRVGNPTTTVLEEKLAALEGGESAVAFATGTSAINAVLFTVLKAGDHAIAGDTCYSSTYYQFDELLRKFGVETTFVDMTDPKNIENALRPNTRLIYCESPANPTVKLVDMEKIGAIGKKHNIVTAIDSTFASPYLQQPLGFGMDLVIHSATKYICGHGDVMGGIVVGTKKMVDEIRDVALKNIGGVISPFNAWLMIRGIRTMEVRMKQHCANAMIIAKFLSDHPKVDRVFYPGLPSHPQHEIAKRQMKDYGGIITFEIKGGVAAGVKLMEAVRVCTLAVSLGDCETLVEHPASMTHWYVSKEEREKAGITDGLVRMSVGIETVEDLLADLTQALGQI